MAQILSRYEFCRNLIHTYIDLTEEDEDEAASFAEATHDEAFTGRKALAIVGPVGAGKTHLFSVMMHLCNRKITAFQDGWPDPMTGKLPKRMIIWPPQWGALVVTAACRDELVFPIGIDVQVIMMKRVPFDQLRAEIPLTLFF